MNKIFKVIWSKSKQCYIVVSEVAKNTTGKKKIVVASVLAALTVGAQVATVQAAIPEGTASNGAALAIGENVKVSNDSSTGLGKDVEVTRRFAVALGFGVKAGADNAVAIGSGARYGTIQANGNDSVAIGTRAEAGMQSSIAIGRLSRAVTGEKGVAIGNEAVTTASSAVAIGNKVNATKDTAISIGNESNATGTAAVAYGNKAQATADSTVAVGDQSKASGANATAVGKSSEATQDSALAAGNGASATAAGAIATGKSASATGVQSIAIGSAGAETNEAPTASGTQSIAIGTKAKASHDRSFAIGSNVQATGVGTTAIGTGTIAKEEGSTAIGSGVNVNTYKATAVGYMLNVRSSASTNIGYTSDVNANQALSVGARNLVTENAQYGTAVGYFAVVSAKNGVAIGSSNDNDGGADTGKVMASGESAVAIGTSAHAEANHAVAIGTRSKAQLAHSVALGEGSTTTASDGEATTGYLTKDAVNNTANGVLAIGNKRSDTDSGTVVRRIVGLASGTNDYDAVNVKQLKALRNETVSTFTVVNGSTSTDVVPTTSVPASVTDANERAKLEKELHKVKFVAGKNITLTADGNAVTIASKSEVSSIASGNTDAISITTGADGKVSVTPNLATDVTKADDANKLVTAGTVKEALADKVGTAKLNEELAKKANASDITNLGSAKLDKTAELHVKKGSYAVDTDGNVTLNKADGTGTVKSDEAVTITGLASKTALDNLKTEVGKKANAADLTSKIDEVNAELAKKASTADLNTALGKKVDKAAFDQLKDVLAGKVDTAALDKMVAALSNKVDEDQLNQKLDTVKDEQAKAIKKAVDAAKAASDTGVNDLKAGKLDKTAELHVVKGEYEVDGDGNVTLKKANGENAEVSTENVVIKGVASKAKLEELAGKVTTAEGDITTLKAGVKENKDGLAGLTTKVEGVEKTANKAKEDLGKLTTKVEGIGNTVAEQGGKITAQGEKIAAIEKNITDNVVTNDSMAGKLAELKTELGANTTLSFAGDTTIDDKGTEAADDDDNSVNKLSLNLKDKTLKVKGATDEITTTAKGDTITVGLSAKVKEDLAKIAKLGDTTADGRDGANGTAKDTGLTGQDGLNGKTLTDKVNALRNGEAGSVVYTDADGKRLVKANDGKYYLAKDVGEDGNKIGAAKPVEGDNLKASVVNPEGTTNPTTLSNLKDGKIAAGSKDAVTGNQLHTTKDEIAKALGGNASVNADGSFKAPEYTLKDKAGNEVTVNNVGAALSTINERFGALNNATNGELEKLKKMENLDPEGIAKLKEYAGQGVNVKGDKNITVTYKTEDGAKTFYTTLSDDLKLGGPDKDHPNVRVNGVDSTITAGKDANEVKMNGSDGTITAGTGNNEVKLDGAKGKVSVGNPKGEKFVELDAATGGVQANKVTAGKDNKAVSLDGDTGTITAGTGANAVAVDGTKASITAGTGTNAVAVDGTKASITAGSGDNKVGINGQNGSVTAKTVTLGKENSPEAVKMDGTKGTITTGKDAKAIEVNGPEGTITLGKKDGDTKVVLNAEKGSVTAKSVTAKDGVFGAPAGEDGIPTANEVATTTINDKGLSTVYKDKKGKESRVDFKEGRLTAGAPVNEKGEPKAEGTAMSMDRDNGFSVTSTDKDGNVSKVTIKDGKISGLNGAEYNTYEKDKAGKIVTDKDGNPKVASSVKMDGAGLMIAPSTGDPKQSVSLTKDGLNNGGNRITNVAPGELDTDAATVGQVKEVTNRISNVVEKTAQRVNQVGAHSAALAAMNPLGYDPLRKSQIMAGIGSYGSQQALALGLAHFANENFLFNVGFTVGEGTSMANLGATYRFGTGGEDGIPERYKGGPISSMYVLQDEVTSLKAENAEMKTQIQMLMQRIDMLASK